MEHFTTWLVTLSLTVAAFLLATFGLYVSNDALVYISFLRELLKPIGKLGASADAGFKKARQRLFKNLDRAYLMQINDPLLI